MPAQTRVSRPVLIYRAGDEHDLPVARVEAQSIREALLHYNLHTLRPRGFGEGFVTGNVLSVADESGAEQQFVGKDVIT